MRAERRRLARQDALAQVASRLRDGIRGARALPDAIALAAETAPAALKEDLDVLRRAVADRGAAEGLDALASATDDPMLRRFARSLAGAYRTGSRKTGELLEIVAEAAWLQSRTEREIRSRQTHIRVARHVIAAVPLIVLLVLRATNPQFVQAYDTPSGQLVMLGGLGLIALGWWSAGSIGRRR
jgi:tight adherence protein B